MIRRPTLVALACCSLAGCSGDAPMGAAESASRLLTAAYAGDRVAFEAEIDRAAVREDVRRQVAQLARARALEVDGGPSEFALDRMISPAALRLVRRGAGEALSHAPTPQQLAPMMRAVDAKHACLKDAEAPHRCLLTFAKVRNDWRLVGMQAMNLRIELATAL